jgi:hypothetical protein
MLTYICGTARRGVQRGGASLGWRGVNLVSRGVDLPLRCVCVCVRARECVCDRKTERQRDIETEKAKDGKHMS